ncbi:E3 ubiquitin-protein ligase pellino homolog 1 [Engraulis encrasicolus]|uniref:E3 ubiquitin-protein ligase pellino homolog 1 n=1 Tax=Engraulis encrasicolus TaxID=184585 RepID=UPI002FD30699
MFALDQDISSFSSPCKPPTKYGELIILGYNGSFPNGDRGRRKSHFSLFKRPRANGVKPSTVHAVCSPQAAKAISNKDQHSISYTLSRAQTVVVEYTHDSTTDMFQIGRSTEGPIDFVVTDTVPCRLGHQPYSRGDGCSGGMGGMGSLGGMVGGGGVTSLSSQSTISRFACRIVCQRHPPYTARICAAGFDSSKNIFLGEKAAKWKTPDGLMDGLTTNGVLVMHPRHGFTQDSRPSAWREISVCGNVFTLRETRSAQQRGKMVEKESHELRDGSLIDLCGVTLLWRTAEGLARTPSSRHLEALRQELNAARPQCPVGLNTLAFPSLRISGGGSGGSSAGSSGGSSGGGSGGGGGGGGGGGHGHGRGVLDSKQPWVYLKCGHVHGYHPWSGGHSSSSSQSRRSQEIDEEDEDEFDDDDEEMMLMMQRTSPAVVVRDDTRAASGQQRHSHHHHHHQHQESSACGPDTARERECPMCRTRGPYVPLWLGCEPAFYLDAAPPTHAFVPCGHVCSEKTAAFWSRIPLPYGTHAFHLACPFCLRPLRRDRGFVRLIFQGPLD